jgi:hypothetical protein
VKVALRGGWRTGEQHRDDGEERTNPVELHAASHLAGLDGMHGESVDGGKGAELARPPTRV